MAVSGEQRRALRVLAGSAAGATEAMMLAHGFRNTTLDAFRRNRPWRLAGPPMTHGNMRANGGAVAREPGNVKAVWSEGRFPFIEKQQPGSRLR
jgi:hypothetical protein